MPNPTWIGGLHHALSHPNSWKSTPGSLKNCNCPKFHQEIPFFAPWQRGFNFGWSLEGIRFGHFKESDLVTSRNQILSNGRNQILSNGRNQILSDGRNQIWSFKESDLVTSRNQIWSFKESDLVNWKESDFVKKESENVLFSSACRVIRRCVHAHAQAV